ncbi:putative uncharacterized protein DDB_G0289263 [Bombus bifarius]|uniref:Pre-C2HC domain-containing protein n=1 Tax=Bombus bifarius TaxID=103933 RepID=A0A6P8NHU0_9HYME|nr:putative uncharacterized protein DDB_G0289263 [Bombus bifarius]
MENMQQIPPITILNKGETYFINRAVDTTNTKQSTNEDRDCSVINELEMEITQNNDEKNNIKGYRNRKATMAIGNSSTKLLQLTARRDSDPAEKPITHIPKPPPIYIDAKIIDPLIDLLNSTAGKENYTIKQLKFDQTNTSNIYEELAKVGHQIRTINNITRYDTKQPLPLFLIELEPKNNNKEIFEVKKVLNTIITVEPLRHIKDIPQCMRCQKYGYTKNYCNRNPTCVKWAGKHLTMNCPHTGKTNYINCYNCSGNHPASYKGCIVRKQLQRKLSPPLQNRTYNNYHKQQDSAEIETSRNVQHVTNINHNNTNTNGSRSYAQVTKQSTPLDNQNQNNNMNDATETKELLKQSIKNTEMLTKMISEQNAVLRQQTQQIIVIQVSKEYIQATTVTVQTSSNYLQLSAVYVPQRHKITSQMWEEYFQHLGDKYIAPGDYNSKHTLWGSRIATPRVTKGLNANKLNTAPSLELTSDHTPIIITYRNKPILHNNSETCNKTTKMANIQRNNREQNQLQHTIENNRTHQTGSNSIDRNYPRSSMDNHYT